MDRQSYRDEIRFRLTGDLLELELDDTSLDRVLNAALRELQRYICSTKTITIPFSKCIDLANTKDPDTGELIKVSSVSRIFRTSGIGTDVDSTSSVTDPMYASQWQLISGTGNMDNFQDYMYNYMTYNTLSQIRNSTSTDLSFKFDKAGNKLYINISTNQPTNITIDYIPRYDDISEITSDYWIDNLVRLAVALTKVTVGRIRSRYTQANALWSQDGQQLLDEGNKELEELRTYLQTNTQLVYPVD